MSQIDAPGTNTITEIDYESLVQDALRDLSAAESDDILEPVGSGDEGPVMAWFIA